MKMGEWFEGLVGKVLLGAAAVAALGLTAHALGWLPPGLERLWLPFLLGTGAVAGAAEASRNSRGLLGRGLIRCSRAMAAVTLFGLAAIELVGIDRFVESALAPRWTAGFVALCAGALLTDAALMRRAKPPRLAVVGAVCGGIGLLTYAGGLAAGAPWLFWPAIPLMGVAGFAYFRVRSELAALRPGAEAQRIPAPVRPFKWSRGPW
jgi:hypothetical protein